MDLNKTQAVSIWTNVVDWAYTNGTWLLVCGMCELLSFILVSIDLSVFLLVEGEEGTVAASEERNNSHITQTNNQVS